MEQSNFSNIQHQTVMEASEQEEGIFRVKIQANRQEGVNYNVKIEQNQLLEQGISSPQTKLSQKDLQRERLILKTNRASEKIRKQLPISNDIFLEESSSNEKKNISSFKFTNYSHQTIFESTWAQQPAKDLQDYKKICEDMKVELNDTSHQQLSSVPQFKDIKFDARKILIYYKLRSIHYTSEELETVITKETLLSNLKVRNWKQLDIKRSLRDMARQLLRQQIYLIGQIYKSEQEGRREQLQAQFKEELSILREVYLNENRQIDEQFPNEREPLINRLACFNKLPSTLKTPQRQRYLSSLPMIQQVKVQEEVQLLVRMEESDK